MKVWILMQKSLREKDMKKFSFLYTYLIHNVIHLILTLLGSCSGYYIIVSCCITGAKRVVIATTMTQKGIFELVKGEFSITQTHYRRIIENSSRGEFSRTQTLYRRIPENSSLKPVNFNLIIAVGFITISIIHIISVVIILSITLDFTFQYYWRLLL